MIEKLKTNFIFLYLVLFPLGQLMRIDLEYSNQRVTLLAVDCVVGAIAIMWLFLDRDKQKLINSFTVAVVFSYVFSLSFFSLNEVLVGGLYLVRLLSYGAFYFAIKHSIRKKRAYYAKILIVISSVIALGGFVQYALFPSLITLIPYGWDPHLYRLVGTYLDAGFTGLLLVLSFVFVFVQFARSNSKLLFPLVIIIVLSLLLTYSRASYLAFLVSSTILLVYPSMRDAKRVNRGMKLKGEDPLGVSSWGHYLRLEQRKLLLGIIALFLCSIPFLPRPQGEGVRLERTTSVYQRVENYNSTFDLVAISPIFGIGYNNTCLARKVYGVTESGIHSCSGTDSSLLLLLITTGVTGVITFAYTLSKHFKFSNNAATFASFGGLVCHSFFQNSLFYPWVLGWFILIVSIEGSD